MDLNAFPFDLNEEPLFDLNEEPLFDLNQELHDLNGEEENFATGEESNTHITADSEEVHEVQNESHENIQEEQPQNNDEEQLQMQRKVKMLSNEERITIYQLLLQKSVDGKLPQGVKESVASSFSVCRKTIDRIWKRAKESETHDVSHKKTKNSGRKRVEIDLSQLREIPLSQRTTVRTLAVAMKTNTSAMYRLIQSGAIKRHLSAIKPQLTEEGKRLRLEFCLSMLEGIPHDPMFQSMYNIIHIDEKWFYMTKKSERYYLLPDEDKPHRSCKSKNFVPKVMFLTAVARPRFDSEKNVTFSGKIGIFPFVTQEPAKRTSVNRVAGTMETKAITSINRDLIRSVFIEKVLPATKEVWPRDELGSTIFIQQDNARTHINPDDPEFVQAATQDGFDIRLMCQPPNSPDFNVLDLGFFSAIQSLHYKEAPKTIDELVNAVVKSFENYCVVKSNFIFLSLQLCMIETMKAKGSNRYTSQHMQKEKLETEEQLPIQLKCDPILVQETLDYLNNN
ncbi:uncharacterized protein LOC114378929 [Glycine soja]|uniref:uncharacterized protein LOC114378929 n=1 Tax=Glycine soja TaxID=3848 RepID=UPI00103DD238|nr:uncharacterized protein LOC114378929 [Glycine soja]